MKKYMQFLYGNECWSLNIRLQQEYSLKKRREELMCYRKNGVFQVHDIVKFNLLHHSMVTDGKL